MLANWTIYKSSPLDVEVGITTITPIIDSGSLRIKDNDATLVSLESTEYTPGLTRGRMRMLIRITDVTIYGGDQKTGFYFMSQNGGDLTNGTVVMYSAYTILEDDTSARRYGIGYYPTGLAGAETTLFLSSPVSLMTNGVTVLPIQIEWEYESELGGVRMYLDGTLDGTDTDTDFTNLSTLAQLIVANPSYVLTTSDSEGFFYYGGVVPSSAEIEYDQVTIVELTPI